MKFSAVSSVALLAAAVSAQTTPDPAINTPSGVTTCQPILLTFSGTHPPFIISVVPGGQPGAQAIETIGTTSDTSLTWKVDLQAGLYVGFHIVDAIGAAQDSAAITINAGSDISCLGGGSSSSGSASSTAGSSSAAGSSSSAGVSTTASISSSQSSVVSTSAATSATSSASGASVTSKASTSTSASASSSSAASTSTTSSNAAAPTNGAQWAVIALGVVGAAALV